ncbi:glycosyltransferase [Anaerostipes caccae]|uniref:glycosyltransferase n=1 Tax=Anaerostipes caccae TaxID=105841 RepID=UPI00101CCF77|nr:glycosyltransferase [Anaerostipes caccae]
MIFVTVGTHEQQFNRLIREVDELKGSGIICEDVIIQTGYSTYKPQFCEFEKLYSYDQMCEYVSSADITITHGGPSSFIMPLQFGKIPIVVPRQKKFDEHVNNHQIDFSIAVNERFGNIIVLQNIKDLKDTLLRYEDITEEMSKITWSNNKQFNDDIERIVNEMF